MIKKSKAVKPNAVFCTKATPRQDSRSAGGSPRLRLLSVMGGKSIPGIRYGNRKPICLLYLNELRGGCLCSVPLILSESPFSTKGFGPYLLAQYPNWVLSPQQIYEHVWKEDPVDCDHIVRNTICRLRRKLAHPELIQTVVGYGYKFVVESGADQ